MKWKQVCIFGAVCIRKLQKLQNPQASNYQLIMTATNKYYNECGSKYAFKISYNQ